jgi:2-isopropylmalate synthase
VISEQREDGRVMAEATIKLYVGYDRFVATAEGNGPVNALDAAFRQAVGSRFPALANVHLTDYKVRVLDTSAGTGAVTRVLIDSTDGERTWSTIGVSENVIDASWDALSDSIVYALLHASES